VLLIQEASVLIAPKTILIRVSKSGSAVQYATARVPVMPVRELVKSVVTGVKLVRVAESAAPVRAMVAIISRIKPCNSPRGLL
jgi:hypothetical protein